MLNQLKLLKKKKGILMLHKYRFIIKYIFCKVDFSCQRERELLTY